MAKIKKSDLENLPWNDISIQKNANGDYILILVTPNENDASNLYDLIVTNSFDLLVLIDKTKNTYSINLEFLNSDYVIGYDTARTADSYPPLKWLSNAQVKYITTGYWGVPQNGVKICNYNPNIFPIPSSTSTN
jgi:hypothetical protein